MKKKLFLLALMVALFACVLVISVGAKDISTGYFDLEGKEIVVPTYDSDGDSLVWVLSTMKNRAEQYGIALANGENYYEISDNGTTYYIFGQKSKEAFAVDGNYTLGIVKSRGVSSDTILVANFDGLVHEDGTGAQQFGFLMRNGILKYVYIPASIISTKCTNNNAQVFLGDTNLSQVEFGLGSKITELGPSAFKSCAITEIVLPEGLTFIDERAFDACTSLKKIYIPKTVTFIDEIAFRGVTDAEYYFTGTEETASSWEITDEIQYVNHCDVYYGGNHQISDGVCTRCEKIIYCENPAHNLEVSITYDSYLASGVKKTRCLDCDSEAKEVVALPLFTFRGFSAAEYADGGMSIGFNVNNEAISEYEEITGRTVNYGVFAGLKDKIGNSDIFDGDGNAASGVIAADITDCSFDLFNLKIVGFTSEQADIKLAIGAYVGTSKNGVAEYTYMQGEEPENGDKYFFASYNDIVAIVVPKEEVTQ